MSGSILINGLFIFMLAGFIGFRGDPARVSAIAHTSDVAHQRPGRHRRSGRHRAGGRTQKHAVRGARHNRSCGRDQQHRRRIPDHGPHAQDVQVQPSGSEIMNEFAGSQLIIEIIYLLASALFILSLKWMSSPTTARQGVWAGELGMVLAIGGTLLHHGMNYQWIAIALVLGTIIGIPLGRVQMTAVPQRTALSHAFGALCVTLVGTAEFYLRTPDISRFMMAVLSMEVILGSLTFTGSLMAAGKLQEVLPQRPLTYKGQNLVNFLLLADRGCAGRLSRAASGSEATLSLHAPDRACVRCAAGHSDRRRRHAHRHLALECAMPDCLRPRWALCLTTSC